MSGTQLRATYLYDGRSRLVSSVRVNVANAGTTRYLHDNEDRIIAEVGAAGTTLREYVWLDDMPVAVLDGSSNPANPTLFWVQADHLNRPVVMYNAAQAVMWKALYEPFGTVHSITGPAANDNRFPGQLFQLESGLAYNWHRHYDATIGRYVSADPLGLAAMLSDGPSVYGYAGMSPLMWVDEDGRSKLRGTGNKLKFDDHVIKDAQQKFPDSIQKQIDYVDDFERNNSCSKERKEMFRQFRKTLRDGRLLRGRPPGIFLPIPTPPSVYCPLIGCGSGPV